METPKLDLFLKPHRSLPRAGFVGVMLALCLASFAAGMVFLSVGAWPVLPFLGLDIFLVWLAFRINYVGARACERIRLYKDRLEIVRIDPWGRKQTQTLEPYWLRVCVDERVTLRSHGQSTVVGAFLSVAAQADLAAQLEAALQNWRAV